VLINTCGKLVLLAKFCPNRERERTNPNAKSKKRKAKGDMWNNLFIKNDTSLRVQKQRKLYFEMAKLLFFFKK
jgi:hypothetical protein